MQAQRRHVARRERAPPDKGWWQELADFAGAKLQQAMATAASKSVGKARGGAGVEVWRVVVGLGHQTAVRRQAQAEAGHGPFRRHASRVG